MAAKAPKPSRDLEEILGGRVLGWVGGIAVTIAAIFFVVMAVRNGWIFYRRWAWLAAAAYVVSVPQAAAWLYAEHDHRLWLTLVVATAFWLLYVVAALGYEVRTPTESLRLSSASLLFVNASVAAAGVWWLLDDAGHRGGANAWLFGLAA